MNQSRKILGKGRSSRRAALLRAAEEILLEEGADALTTRYLAERAGVKFQVIYYYFYTLDDLILEVFESVAQRNLERLQEDLTSENPLQALWRHHSDPSSGSGLVGQFFEMSKSNEGLRRALAAHVRALRESEAEGLSRYLEAHGANLEISSLDLALLLAALGRSVRAEAEFGETLYHDRLQALAENWIARIECRID